MYSVLRASVLALAFAAFAADAGAQGFFGNGGLSPVSRAQRFGGACQDCDLSNRALPGVRIEQGDFSRARFVRAFLVRMDAAGSIFTDADFSLANMTAARLVEAQCEGARFSGAVMAGVDGSRATLERADFANAELPDAVLVQARLANASFSGAKAMRANFLRADLRNVTFAYARLDGADFTQADMRGANLAGASLAGANLEDARNLAPSQLRGACGDAETKLPAGWRLPECGTPPLTPPSAP
jgi:uncharacterized protein YjbI with pentapeptide repeats